MKKIIALVLAALMVFALASCTKTDTNSGKKTYKVGICNYVSDASLNQIVENIQNRLTEIGKEKDVEFKISYDNCEADPSVMNQIIADFIADEVDIMVGVATPVAMAMQSATEDNQIPVIFAAVSDPEAAELVESNEKPGANITGTSDFLNTNALLDLVLAQNPEAKTIGLLYDIGQDSSTTPIASAKAYLDAKNISYVEKTGSTADEIKLAAQALVKAGVDAVFTPTDNSIMTAEMGIYEIFADAKIPHYCGADSFALNGAFLGFGVDYANLGVETANMAAEVLIDGKEPATLAVKTFDNGTATINTEICEALGLNFDELKEAFKDICTQVNSITTAESFDDVNK